jgi:hypothetical protein
MAIKIVIKRKRPTIKKSRQIERRLRLNPADLKMIT